ncbi:hypothetical protein OSB04_009118 [Centaurea solstitialis]|uniref:CCHC-type domain-containing protein n=1 Tax=Centaurea solstitialis TaxID=347529 RepID=A0AA38TVK4_9ASTR|nr:hypothetical protein OSB04_009118 [Centaurea solstitialis]
MPRDVTWSNLKKGGVPSSGGDRTTPKNKTNPISVILDEISHDVKRSILLNIIRKRHRACCRVKCRVERHVGAVANELEAQGPELVHVVENLNEDIHRDPSISLPVSLSESSQIPSSTPSTHQESIQGEDTQPPPFQVYSRRPRPCNRQSSTPETLAFAESQEHESTSPQGSYDLDVPIAFQKGFRTYRYLLMHAGASVIFIRRDRQIEELQRTTELITQQLARLLDDKPRSDSSDPSHYNSDESGRSPIHRRRVRDDLRDVKADAPEFHGGSNTDDFIEWLNDIENLFDVKGYSDEKSYKAAVLKLKKYASLWWENMKAKRERRVASLSIDDYTREFEQLVLRSGIEEKPEQTMARYVGGLNHEIAEKLELQPYWSFGEVCKLASKIEMRAKYKKAEKATLKPFSRYNNSFQNPFYKENPPKGENPKQDKGKGPIDAPKKKCFKCQGLGHFQAECPNRRVMTLKEVEEVHVVEEGEDEMPIYDEECYFEERVKPDEGELLVIRRSLHAKEVDPNDEQREQIFHSRCTIKGKVCSLIIDSGSCTNVASTNLINKLGILTSSNPNPYKLQWLNQGSDMKVTKQALLSFSIGKSYQDQVLCDVIPMDACHMLLGRPWQYDRRVLHDGYQNTYSFVMNKKKVILEPLPSTLLQKQTEPG